MAAALGWAAVMCLVTVLFVNIGQSATPFTSSGAQLGARCRDDRMCVIPNSYCQQQSGNCVCKSGHTRSRNNDNCIKVPARADLGDHCIADEDCAFTREASRCSENMCRRCSDGSEREFSQCDEAISGCAYHEYDGNCFKYRKLGEPCEVHEECWINPNFDKTRNCVNEICQCAEGYDLMSGPIQQGKIDQCTKQGHSSAAGSASVSSLLLLLLLISTVKINWC